MLLPWFKDYRCDASQYESWISTDWFWANPKKQHHCSDKGWEQQCKTTSPPKRESYNSYRKTDPCHEREFALRYKLSKSLTRPITKVNTWLNNTIQGCNSWW